jgi:hypothetical protein
MRVLADPDYSCADQLSDEFMLVSFDIPTDAEEKIRIVWYF